MRSAITFGADPRMENLLSLCVPVPVLHYIVKKSLVHVQYEGPRLEIVAAAPCFVTLLILANCVLSCKLVLDATVAHYLPDGSSYFIATN